MPVKILFCYAREDELFLNQLKAHLKPLQRQKLIEMWHDRDINAGLEWEKEISKQLNTAQIILLLISPDFMNSDYCYGVELQRALERHQRGEVQLIPIILRHVHWQSTLGKIQALPKDAKPVKSWTDQDEAFFTITEHIRELAEKLQPTLNATLQKPDQSVETPPRKSQVPAPAHSSEQRDIRADTVPTPNQIQTDTGRELINGPGFNQFTERAQKALSLAREEAQRLQHDYIGTEHLLLGLLREGEGVAAKILSNLGVELNKVRMAVEFIIRRGNWNVQGEISLTLPAKKVIELAVDEARHPNHHPIGTEHLLLGLLREGKGIAAGVLESLGVNLEKVRAQTLQAVAMDTTTALSESQDVFKDTIPAKSQHQIQIGSYPPEDSRALIHRLHTLFTESAWNVFSLAIEEAKDLQHNYFGTEHLLLGLIREEEGIAARLLNQFDIEFDKARSAVEFIIGRGDRIVQGEIGLTPRVGRVLGFAEREARRRNHSYIGTGHLLFGLVEEGEGIAAGILESLGMNLEKVRRQTTLALNGPLNVYLLNRLFIELNMTIREKEQAIEQQRYELAGELHQREIELREQIDSL